MIYFEFYSFIIPKVTLELKYPGGLEQFKLAVTNLTFLEDDHLASARFLRLKEIDNFLNFIQEQGLHYDKEKNHSDDFAIMSWIGLWWQADWLQADISRCFMK